MTKKILLWPGVAPGSEKIAFNEHVEDRSSDPYIKDRAVTQIKSPSLEVYLPKKSNGASMLVAPGGSLARVVIDKEGADIAEWLNTLGITVFVLTYRLPSEGHDNRQYVPLQDAQRAMRLIRSRAHEFNLDPEKTGAMGFSAGGYVISHLGTCFNQQVYSPVDDADKCSARPDCMVLMYPVISMEQNVGHVQSRISLLGDNPDKEDIDAFSTDKIVNSHTPKTFLCHASDDASVWPENSIRFYQSLQRSGVDAELHLYMQGNHGFGIRFTKGLPVAAWTDQCRAWMTAIGFIE
jgi:acetyl esterase/lipase